MTWFQESSERPPDLCCRYFIPRDINFTLNDVGQKNGEFQVWADGVCIMNIASSFYARVEISLIISFSISIQIVWACFPHVRGALVRGTQIEMFFGGLMWNHCYPLTTGHDPSWASPKDQYSWFKDFSAAVLA
jgi:hypothetical protein